MIYELNVKLIRGAYYRDGVSRKLRIGGSATLDDLADLILESVGFDDDHLYDFEIDGEYYERMPSDFDPCEKSNVKIYSTSLKKGTKFFFNFDYGDCWRFEIKVAKVIDESGNIKPEIIESKGTVEQYPSWDDWDDYDGDNTEILDYDDGELFDNVASLETFRKLYSLGEEFKKLKPWKYLSNSDEIEIILPSGEKGYFCIMGNGEIEYGFSLYLGDIGHRLYRIMERHEMDSVSDEHAVVLVDSINMWLVDKDDIPQEQIYILDYLGKRYRGDNSWIYFDRFEPGFMPFTLCQEDADKCIEFLSRLLEVIPSAKKWVGSVHPEYDEFNSFLSYEFNKTNWTFKIKPYDLSEDLYIQKRNTIDFNFAKLKKQKKNQQVWEYECSKMRSFVDDDNYSKPLMPNIVAICDNTDGYVLHHKILEPGVNQVQMIEDDLADAIIKNGRPDKIIVEDKLIAGTLHNICDACGITVEIGKIINAKEVIGSLNNEAVEEDIENIMNALGLDPEIAIKKAAISEEEFMKYAKEQMKKTFSDNPEALEKLMLLGEDFDDVDDYDMEFDDIFGADYEPIELKSTKAKIAQVKNIFGEGEYDEELLDDFDPMISCEFEKDANIVLENATKTTLLAIAESLGMLVDNGYKKPLLVGNISSYISKNPAKLKEILSSEEIQLIKYLIVMEKDMEAYFVDDFDFGSKVVISLIEKGLLDVACYSSEDWGMQLELRPLAALKKAVRKK